MAELDGEGTAAATIDTGVDPTGATVITVSGELDISNAKALETTLASIKARRPQQLIFDLAGLRFIDSAGIAVLIGAASDVEDVRLRRPSLAVRRVVELTGLAEVLPIES